MRTKRQSTTITQTSKKPTPLNAYTMQELKHELAKPIPLRLQAWLWLRRCGGAINEWPRQMYAWWHRGWHGWAQHDTWSFDTYLARIISAGVLYLRVTAHGHPSQIKSMKEWKRILSDVAYTFMICGKSADDEWALPIDGTPWTMRWYRKQQKFERTMPRMFHTHIITRSEYRRYQRGWVYFRQFFHNLWD